VKSSTKPQAWTLSPQMTAAPELWRGCILMLPFWEGASNVARDASGYGRDGTISGATSVLRDRGRTLSFDGNDEVQGNLRIDTATGPYSWSWWSYTDTVEQKWMWVTPTLSDGFGFGVWDGAGEFRAYAGASNQRWAGSSGDVVAGQWQHWVVIHDGSTITQVYRNGVELSGTTGGGAIDSTVHEIGQQANSFWQPWSGDLDLPTVWNRGLAVSEIRKLYHDPSAMIRPAGF
jgi:hypothetical protein